MISRCLMELLVSCSGNRGYLIYNRIFARSRAPKCVKLGLGASAVHVRSRPCSRFFGVGPQKGAYCELVSSLSSLDTASEKEPGIRRVFFCAPGNTQPTRGHAGTYEGPRAATTRATRTSRSGTYDESPSSSSSSSSSGAEEAVSLSSSPSRARLRFLPAAALEAAAHGIRKFEWSTGAS